MKNVKLAYLGCMLLASVSIPLSCNKDDAAVKKDENKNPGLVEREKDKFNTSNARLNDGSYVCGDGLSGRTPANTPNGYYIYPLYKMDFSNVPQGATITITCQPVDVPNKFSVRASDQTTTVATSDWRGVSSQPGPWGNYNLNQPGNYFLTFTKGSSNIYYFFVESVIQNNPDDTWTAGISCQYVPPCNKPVCDTIVCPPCPASVSFDGRTPLNQPNGYYTYAYRYFDLSNVPVGKPITLIANPVDVPNRFTVRDALGNTVLVSDWRGYTCYDPYSCPNASGPWGPFLNNPGNYVGTFTRGASSIYYLMVETVIPNQSTSDVWTASISCQ